MANIFVCGDVFNRINPEGNICAQDLVQIVKSADCAICNFEGPIAGYGTPRKKIGIHLDQTPGTIDGLREQGFDILLLANNHIMDFGQEALTSTMDKASECGLDTLGAGLDRQQAYKPMVRTIDGIKIGMINACEAQFGVLDYFSQPDDAGYAWINHAQIDKNVIELSGTCDYVIVFSHAGLENYHVPQKEWRERYRHLCDLGADVVIGSHTHTPQGFEQYNGSLIFYSLGNFYFGLNDFAGKKDMSYSVLLRLSPEKMMDFDIISHHREGGKVMISDDGDGVDINWLNALLQGDKYRDVHDRMSLEAYKRISKQLRYSLTEGFYEGSLKKTLKHKISRLLGRRSYLDRQLLQLHLMRNEAYYYAARHALELKNRDNLSIPAK